MYFHQIETSAKAKNAHNVKLKESAKMRLAFNKANAHKTEPKPECAPNRKAKARLDRRIKDWEACRANRQHDMKVQMRIDGGGFHKPGSMQ